jgi:hypothetical protein
MAGMTRMTQSGSCYGATQVGNLRVRPLLGQVSNCERLRLATRIGWLAVTGGQNEQPIYFRCLRERFNRRNKRRCLCR